MIRRTVIAACTVVAVAAFVGSVVSHYREAVIWESDNPFDRIQTRIGLASGTLIFEREEYFGSDPLPDSSSVFEGALFRWEKTTGMDSHAGMGSGGGIVVTPLGSFNIAQVTVRLWFLFLVVMIYLSIVFIRGPYRRYRRKNKALCLKCGYDLTGNVSGICPECGERT